MRAHHLRVRQQIATLSFTLLEGVGRSLDRQQPARLAVLIHETLLEGARADVAAEQRAAHFGKALPAPIVDEAIERGIHRKTLTLLRSLHVEPERPTVGQCIAEVRAHIVDAIERRADRVVPRHAVGLTPPAVHAVSEFPHRLTHAHRRLLSSQSAFARERIEGQSLRGCRLHDVDHATQGITAELHTRRSLGDFDALGRNRAQSADVPALDERTSHRLAINQHQYPRIIEATNGNRRLRRRRRQLLQPRQLPQQLIGRHRGDGIELLSTDHGHAARRFTGADHALSHRRREHRQHRRQRHQSHHRRAALHHRPQFGEAERPHDQ